MGLVCRICGFVKEENEQNNCPICDNNNWIDKDLNNLREISPDPKFIEAMLSLKEKDIIEYQLKMSQFRNQAQQQKTIEEQKVSDSTPKCPHCHSTKIKPISGTERAASVLGLGILSKKLNKSFKCLDCKYTW